MSLSMVHTKEQVSILSHMLLISYYQSQAIDFYIESLLIEFFSLGSCLYPLKDFIFLLFHFISKIHTIIKVTNYVHSINYMKQNYINNNRRYYDLNVYVLFQY